MRLVLVVGIVLVWVAGAAAQLTVKGDARAWQEVTAAYEKLAKLKSYRVKMTMEGQPGAMVTEHVNPGRTRMVMTVQGMTLESVTVDGKTAYRQTGGGPQGSAWTCRSMPAGGVQAPPEPKAFKGEVTAGRIADATVEGTKTSGYEYTWVTQGQSIKQRLYVAGDGLPRRMVVLDAAGKAQTTMDYYDFNAPITIEAPKCG